MAITFDTNFDCVYGAVDQLSPLVRRVVAHNPGPFTFKGTGTYLIGQGQVAVIDPGPLLDDHVDALLNATEGETISHILITHTHRDHSPAATPLKRATGASTYGYGPHGAHQAPHPGPHVEEGGDTDFHPDITLAHGDVLAGDGWTLDVLHTPGHISNHLCFGLREEKTLFCGDHVMAWSTSVIIPPDGNLREYMASLELLLDRDDTLYWPTHGPALQDPKTYVRDLIDHRRNRSRQIEACIQDGLSVIPDMVDRMYTDIPDALKPAAALSVYAHIRDMIDRRTVRCTGGAGMTGHYRAVEKP